MERTSNADALSTELERLRQALTEVSDAVDRLDLTVPEPSCSCSCGRRSGSPSHAGGAASDTDDRDNIYVFDDDDEEARAFDEFYRAYDESHAKKRRFLLGRLRS